MNKLNISVSIDQKAALLKGLVLRSEEIIEVSPDMMAPDLLRILVGVIDMSKYPPALRSGAKWADVYTTGLSDASVDALIAMLAEMKETNDRAVTQRVAQEIEEMAEREARVTKFEADGIWRQAREDYGVKWEKWQGDHVNIWKMSDDQIARLGARRQVLGPICEAHNAPLEMAVAEAKAAQEAKVEAREKAEKEAKEAALVVTATKRLETGYWERETPEYNSKRESAPWCASVTFPDGAKPVYAWGESTGTWGKAGLMRLRCGPGDIIAWGQKDLRRPDRSQHKIQIMLGSGRMRDVTATEAFRIASLEAAAK